jgi:citrate lyase subunit beta / citryl-CoA lyase
VRAEPEVVLVALYVPGDRPDRFAKAAATGADVVILDLEDAVAPGAKDVAREHVAAWVETGPDTPLQVRVNALDTPWARQDLAMLRSLDGRVGVRIPKVESADDVHAVAAAVGDATRLHPMLETARGVEAAFDVAQADPAVATVGLGEADLASDLGVTGEEALSWARSRLVVAARAAGLPPPMLSVYPQVTDLEGLAASCRAGRALGFVGRTAVHPRQVPVIAAAFQPTPEEVAAATATLRALEQAAEAGTGVLLLPDGRMVDPAMAGYARRVLAIDKAARAHLDRHAPPNT